MLFFSGCVKPPVDDDQASNVTIDSPEIQTEDEENETIEIDWAKEALEQEDPSFCLKLEKENRDDCILPLSNISFENCLMLEGYEYKRGCLFYHAYNLKDQTICDLMSTEDKYECLEELLPPCTLVNGSLEKQLCLAELYGNDSSCIEDDCFFRYAIENNNVESCEKIEELPRISACLTIVLDKNNCSGLEESNKDYCYWLVAEEKKSSSYCYKMDSKSNIAVECFTYFAIRESKPNYCEGLFVLYRWDCYTDYAIETLDVSGCDKIDDLAPASKVKCYNELAVLLNDPRLCNKVYAIRGNLGIACYSQTLFVENNLNLAKCSGITPPDWKNKCYTILAERENDPLICNYIEGEGAKSICHNKFN